MLRLDKIKKIILTFIGFYFLIEFFKKYYLNEGKFYQKSKQIQKSNENSRKIRKYAKETDEIIDSVPNDKLDEFL